MKKETDQEAVLRYCLKGLTCTEIAKLLGLSERTVQRLRRKAVGQMRAKPIPAADRAVELYNAGLSYAEIARRLNITRQTVYNYLKRNGAVRHPKSPAAPQPIIWPPRRM
ncbi:MAG: helix-turn-helix domain-containing protein [Alloprevotella sp.]|nr:helix-turn-helix domain-containing protein [Bacteroidales bacterium]MDY3943433.1 helix-turn-helix domain-containing protein [Alloprevotella sp.]